MSRVVPTGYVVVDHEGKVYLSNGGYLFHEKGHAQDEAEALRILNNGRVYVVCAVQASGRGTLPNSITP